MENLIETLKEFGTVYGIKVIGAVLTLIIGRIVAGALRGGVRKVMTERRMDPGLIGFLGSMIFAIIMILTFIAALGKFGVETASFVAIIGAAGFAVGFALQGSLSNFAAGVMILIFRPFKVGDFVEAAGVVGTVKDIAIFSTTIATGDNVKITVPNGKLSGDIIKNYSGYDTRRVDLLIGVGYGADLGQTAQVLTDTVKADTRVLGDPAPMVAVKELGDSSVNFVVRAWVNGGDYWGVYFDLTRTIKEALDSNDIDIPYPHQVVYMHNES